MEEDIKQDAESEKKRCKICGNNPGEDGLCNKCNCCSGCCECDSKGQV
jgi:hypothetical protein